MSFCVYYFPLTLTVRPLIHGMGSTFLLHLLVVSFTHNPLRPPRSLLHPSVDEVRDGSPVPSQLGHVSRTWLVQWLQGFSRCDRHRTSRPTPTLLKLLHCPTPFEKSFWTHVKTRFSVRGGAEGHDHVTLVRLSRPSPPPDRFLIPGSRKGSILEKRK